MGTRIAHNTADVAKRLRQWIVAPLLAGSSPVIRPFQKR